MACTSSPSESAGSGIEEEEETRPRLSKKKRQRGSEAVAQPAEGIQKGEEERSPQGKEGRDLAKRT